MSASPTNADPAHPAWVRRLRGIVRGRPAPTEHPPASRDRTTSGSANPGDPDRGRWPTQPGRYGKTVIGILTVISEEFDAAKEALGATSRFAHTRYWHGPDGPQRFVLAKMADRTNVVATQGTRDLIEHWRPDVVMVVGIAGALSSSDAGLGDVVVVDYIHYGEFRKITEGCDDLRYAAYDHPAVGLRSDITEAIGVEGRWRDRVLVARPELREEDRSGSAPDQLKCEIGAIVAGEKIYGDPDHPEQEHVLTTFENAVAVDMESWGVGRAVHHQRDSPEHNPRLVIIRGISDIVDRRRPKTVDAEREVGEPIYGEGAGMGMPSDDPVVALSINNEQRDRWKRYAAAAAAAFAAVAVEELTDAV